MLPKTSLSDTEVHKLLRLPLKRSTSTSEAEHALEVLSDKIPIVLVQAAITRAQSNKPITESFENVVAPMVHADIGLLRRRNLQSFTQLQKDDATLQKLYPDRLTKDTEFAESEYFVNNDVLFHHDIINGVCVEQLG